MASMGVLQVRLGLPDSGEVRFSEALGIVRFPGEDGDAVHACEGCGALVPFRSLSVHQAWHKRLSGGGDERG